MGVVDGFTKARMLEIENDTVVAGHITGDDLILVTRGTDEIVAGNVRGPAGTDGTNGTNAGAGPTGPAGPTKMIGFPNNHTTTLALLTTSGDLGLTRNNVSVVATHTYGINVNFTLEWSSLQTDARWDIWCRLNGVNFDRFQVIKPGIGGTMYVTVRGQVFWTPSVTQATDDISVFAEEVTDGANIQASGSVTLKRDLWIIDYGVLP